MSGSTDIILRWGEGNAVKEVRGTLEVDDLDAGESRGVYVAHASDPLALAAAPSFLPDDPAAVMDGLTIEVLAAGLDADDVYRVTDGEGFLLRVTVPATGVTGADLSRGTASWDWDIVWTRRGVAE